MQLKYCVALRVRSRIVWTACCTPCQYYNMVVKILFLNVPRTCAEDSVMNKPTPHISQALYTFLTDKAVLFGTYKVCRYRYTPP